MTAATTLVTGTDFITVATKDFDAAVKFYGTVWACRSPSGGGRCPRPSSRPAT